MGLKAGETDWEQCVLHGEAVIDGDFEEAVSYWCDALESVPEEDFDTLYLRILDSMERSFVQQAWKTTDGMDFCGLEELATMVRIYSPDTYELLPELISRIRKHISDMQRFDYVSEMLDMALLFARMHFCVETYLDSFSEMCESTIALCDDALGRKDTIYLHNKDKEYRDGFTTAAENIKATFSAIKNAIDKEIADLSYDEILQIGFDWMDTEERLYIEKFQHIIDRGLEISDTSEDSLDMQTMKMLVNDFMDVYLKHSDNNRTYHKLQA